MTKRSGGGAPVGTPQVEQREITEVCWSGTLVSLPLVVAWPGLTL